MKKFLAYTLLFITIVAVIDCGFGLTCRYLNSHAKGGDTRDRYYIAKQSSEEILMMGSSRMHHHYVPAIIEDSLHMSAYNCGVDGNGIILSYGYLLMITERYKPHMIIYDISGFDMYEDDNKRYVDLLKQYYNDPGIIDILTSIDKKEKIRLFSSLYRYNSQFFTLLKDFLVSSSSGQKGYAPINKESQEPPTDIYVNDNNFIPDSLKLSYVRKFIEKCKMEGIQLIFCSSPFYGKTSESTYNDPIKAICSESNIPFLDFSEDEEINEDFRYFSDAVHLNEKGSILFTRKLVSALKNL